ncbi:MAG: hypothetical protein ACLR8Y_03680 [Alistipes indistinctus]
MTSDGCVGTSRRRPSWNTPPAVRVPLNQSCIGMSPETLQGSGKDALLPRFSHFGYIKKIKEVLKYVGIDARLRSGCLARRGRARMWHGAALYAEVAATTRHERTFIGGLHKQVKDPNLMASHVQRRSGAGSAFARCRID